MSRLLYYFLKFTVIPALNASLGSARKQLLHLSPMFSEGQYVPAYFEVFFEVKLFLIDVRSDVVEIALSNLFGSELYIRKESTYDFRADKFPFFTKFGD